MFKTLPLEIRSSTLIIIPCPATILSPPQAIHSLFLFPRSWTHCNRVFNPIHTNHWYLSPPPGKINHILEAKTKECFSVLISLILLLFLKTFFPLSCCNSLLVFLLSLAVPSYSASPWTISLPPSAGPSLSLFSLKTTPMASSHALIQQIFNKHPLCKKTLFPGTAVLF